MRTKWTQSDIDAVYLRNGANPSFIPKTENKAVKPKETGKVNVFGEPKQYDVVIGIDTGKNTGFAIWDCNDKKLTIVSTIPIHTALENVSAMQFALPMKVLVRFEDARLRKWFGKSGKEKMQGAGSIKRDAVIWEDFLKDSKIDYQAVAPKDNKTKLTADVFKALTGWDKKTSEHARDAAMLVFNYKQ